MAEFHAIDANSGGEGVSFGNHPHAGRTVRLEVAGGTADVALNGGHVIAWQPHGHKPVVWLTAVGRTSPEAALRGGIPVCWPWFGAHPTDPSKPSHGFVRTRDWRFESAGRGRNGVRVDLSVETSATDHALWPHAARADLRVTLSDTLSVELTTTNTGPDAFKLTQALHTYFAVSDIANVTIDGFDGQTFIDATRGGARDQQRGPIAFPAEVNRIYDAHPGSAVIADTGWQRRIHITKSGSHSSVVWNPWDSTAPRFRDIGPEGWRGYVCVETSNAGTDIVSLAPAAAHVLTAEYRVTGL
jgi:D-hexose-6-phosphate mutarotase